MKLLLLFAFLVVESTSFSFQNNLHKPYIPRYHNKSNQNFECDKAVVFLNLGGPRNLEEVEPFLYNLFSDEEIIRLPIFLKPFQKGLARIIALVRKNKSQKAYASIGGGSPITNYTIQQSKLVEKELLSRGVSVACFVGMRYWYPFQSDAISKIKNRDLLLFPLYPHYSLTTTGSSFASIRDKLNTLDNVTVSVVSYWYNHPKYVDCLSKQINGALDQFTESEKQEGVTVLFSAHGIPKQYVYEGDPYEDQINDHVRLLERRFPEYAKSALGYQSKVGPLKWTGPSTETVIRKLRNKNVLVVPISFVSDHVETLQEIDIEFKDLAIENNLNWKRCPTFNDDPDFIKVISNIILDCDYQQSLSAIKM